MNEWNIQARAHQCHACGQSFQDKQAYHTLLVDHAPDLVRQDICTSCWTREYSEGATDRKGFLSYWQGVYEAPPAAPPDPIQKENAESLLRKLIALDKPGFAAAGYILAVMLERKRLLKVKEQFSRDGRRVFVYEHPKSGDLFTIADPALQLNQLEEVQKVVADLLEHGLTPEGEIAYPQTEPGATANAASPGRPDDEDEEEEGEDEDDIGDSENEDEDEDEEDWEEEEPSEEDLEEDGDDDFLDDDEEYEEEDSDEDDDYDVEEEEEDSGDEVEDEDGEEDDDDGDALTRNLKHSTTAT